MSTLKDRLPSLVELQLELLPTLEKHISNPQKNLRGVATNSLADTLRFLAVADYVLKSDIFGFKNKLNRVGALRLSIFERNKAGEPMDSSYLSMLAYKQLFCALAAGNNETSYRLAQEMGGRPEIEKDHDHPFDQAFGYALKNVVLGAEDALIHVDQFRDICEKKDNRNFIGYAMALAAIVKLSNSAALEALSEIVVGHKKLAKGRGIFAGSEDELISVWGVGIANLMKNKGMAVQIDDPLVPNDLT